jgi:hypothetical protein
MHSNVITSFFRSHCFSVILRGRTVFLGDVEDFAHGDLKISGNDKKAYLQVFANTPNGLKLLGGRYQGRKHGLSIDVAERVVDTLRTLGASDAIMVMAVMLLEDARARRSLAATDRHLAKIVADAMARDADPVQAELVAG